MSEFSDLEFNQMMQEHFGSLKRDKEEQQFYFKEIKKGNL